MSVRGPWQGRDILITGVTGQVAMPLALDLARHNNVTGLARFRDPAARTQLEDAGVTCIAVDLGTGDFAGLPARFDVVLHLAVVKSGRWELDIRANAESTGLLMAHCRHSGAFMHCSSTAVYEPAGPRRLVETDPLGDNHRAIMPTYSIAKIATEAVVRTQARVLGIPTTIARLNVPYGDDGGWPGWHLDLVLAGQPIAVHPDRPNLFNPIHDVDIAALVPGLVDIASVPATIVNLAGDEQVALEEWCTYLGGLVDREPIFEVTDTTIGGVTVDLSKLHDLVGRSEVPWQQGMRRMVAALHPELSVSPEGM